jgi:hypothetical protein
MVTAVVDRRGNCMSTSRVSNGTLAMKRDRTPRAEARGAQVSSPKSQAQVNFSAFFAMGFLA